MDPELEELSEFDFLDGAHRLLHRELIGRHISPVLWKVITYRSCSMVGPGARSRFKSGSGYSDLHLHWRLAFSRERLFLVEHRVNFFDAFVRRETPCPYVTPEKVAVFVPVQRVGGAVKVDVTTFS